MEIPLASETGETFDALLRSDAVSVNFWLKKFAGEAELAEEKKKREGYHDIGCLG